MTAPDASLPLVGASVSGHVFRREGPRRVVWLAKWRDAAGQHKKVLGRDWPEKGPPPPGYLRRRDAEAELQALLTDARRGVVEQVRTHATLAGVAREWIAYGIRERDWKPSTVADNRSVVGHYLVPEFGERRIETITKRQIEQWRNRLVDEDGASRRSANKAVLVLGAVLEHGRREHGLLHNPVRDVKKLRDRYDRSRYDFFSPAEVEALVAAADPIQDAVLFRTAAFTGLRMGELIGLRWRDVDPAAESLHVYASYSAGTLSAPKSGLARTVPMAAQVAGALEDLRAERGAGPDELVFPGPRNEYLDGSALRRRYKEALKRAGLRPLRFHDLRHTFGSIAINQATIVQVQAWMGHADVSTTMKYMHHRSRAGDARLLSAAFAEVDESEAPAPAEE